MHSSFLLCQKHVYESLILGNRMTMQMATARCRRQGRNKFGIHYSSIRSKGAECLASSYIPPDTLEGSFPSCLGHSPWGKQINMLCKTVKHKDQWTHLVAKTIKWPQSHSVWGVSAPCSERACWAPCLVLHVLTFLAIRLVNGVRWLSDGWEKVWFLLY